MWFSSYKIYNISQLYLPDDNFLILTEDVSVTDVTAADIGDSTIAIEAAAISALVLLPGEDKILPPFRFFPIKKKKKVRKKRKSNGKRKEYIMRINDNDKK